LHLARARKFLQNLPVVGATSSHIPDSNRSQCGQVSSTEAEEGRGLHFQAKSCQLK